MRHLTWIRSRKAGEVFISRNQTFQIQALCNPSLAPTSCRQKYPILTDYPSYFFVFFLTRCLHGKSSARNGLPPAKRTKFLGVGHESSVKCFLPAGSLQLGGIYGPDCDLAPRHATNRNTFAVRGHKRFQVGSNSLLPQFQALRFV